MNSPFRRDPHGSAYRKRSPAGRGETRFAVKERFVGQKQGRALVLALVSVVALTANARAEPPAARAAAKPSIESVMRDLKTAGEELSKAMPTPGVILDEAKRRETAPKA